MKKKTEELDEKLKKTSNAKLSADEQSLQIEKLLQEEEKNQSVMSAELAQLRDLCFKKTQKSHELQLQLKNIDADIQVMLCFSTQAFLYLMTSVILVI